MSVIPLGKVPQTLPAVLDSEDVARLPGRGPPRHSTPTLLVTANACGLRINGLLHLPVEDIDSRRMVIVVRQGKGRKDRLVPLSERLLAELRAYWRVFRPGTWLFPGADPISRCPLLESERLPASMWCQTVGQFLTRGRG